MGPVGSMGLETEGVKSCTHDDDKSCLMTWPSECR